jgi:hypothetical protein
MFAFLIPIIWFAIFLITYLGWNSIKTKTSNNEDGSIVVCALLAFSLTFLIIPFLP